MSSPISQPDPTGLPGAIALQGFLDAAPDAIVVSDSTGRILFTNALTGELFDYPREQLLGQPIELLVSEGQMPAGSQASERSKRGPLSGNRTERVGRRRDGREFAVELSRSSLPTGAGDLALTVFRDLTPRRQAEAKFRGLLESAPDGIVVVDSSGSIVIVNTQTERIFGFSREQLLGQPIEMLVPEKYRERHVAHRQGYLHHPRARPMGQAGMSLVGRKQDGTEFPLEISLSPMHTEDGLLVSAAIRDITARKQVEDRLRSSLKEKEILLKEIHHRVKNNLQIVSSMLNLQAAQITDPHAREIFQESQARVRSIALFHEKLYQSRDLAHIDIAEYLNGVSSSLLSTYGVNPDKVRLSIHVEDIPLGVDAAISCGLIVNELLSNALKHAFPGERRGEIQVELRAEGLQVTLEVSDDGVGLPPGLDLQSPKTLGLRLVSILIDQVQGTLELERQEKTRFIVRFARKEGA